MKKLILFVTCLSLYNVSTSQNLRNNDSLLVVNEISLTYEQANDSIFSALDTSKIVYKLLKERSLTYIDWAQFDGSSSNIFFPMDTIIELYYEITQSQFSPKRMKTLNQIDSIANLYKSDNLVPLMLLDYKYQQIKEQAYLDGWIIRDGFQIIDNSPINETPYEIKELIALTSLSETDPNLSSQLILPSSLILSNTDLSTATIQIDFNLGNGFQQVFPDIAFECPNNYQDHLNASVLIIKSSDTIICNFRLTRESEQIIYSTQPVDSVKLTVDGIDHYYGVWLGCGNDVIRKPIMVVEGYDIDNHRFLSSNTTLNCDPKEDRNDNDLYELMNVNGMADNLRKDGFDLIILNYGDGTLSLEDKAKVVVALINEINLKLIQEGSYHEIIILGPSEGAVVSRFALAQMEENSINHRVKLFVSFDGPHQGANTPLSMQCYFQFLELSFPRPGEPIPHLIISYYLREYLIKPVMDIISAKPTRQLLTNNITDPTHIEHNNFYSSLNSLNFNYGYPRSSRNVAMTEGSLTGQSQGFEPGAFLFQYILGSPWWLDPILKLYVEGNGFALPNDDNYSHPLFHGYTEKRVGIFNFLYFQLSIGTINKPFDNAPGGNQMFTYGIKKELSSNPLLDYFTSATIHTDSNYPSENFIPLISSLDIQNTDDLFLDLSQIIGQDGLAFKDIDYSTDFSPFDAIFAEPENKLHVICGLTPGIIQFTIDEIMPKDLFLQNRIVNNYTDFEGTNNVFIGRNVSSRIPEGDFEINSKSNITAGNTIILKPGTKLTANSQSSVLLQIKDFQICEYPEFRSIMENPEVTSSIHQDERLSNKPINIEGSEFRWFPNPTSEIASIQFSLVEESNIEITLMDLLGNIIINIVEPRRFSKGQYTLNPKVGELKPGVYICLFKKEGVIVQLEKIVFL
jgi:hypothetical protein